MCNGLISTFYRCQLVLIGGGGELEISIIELPLTYCFVHIILTMPIKFSYLCFAFCLVIFCVLFRKCLNTLLSLEFHHKLLSCLYLAILSNYLTWCISIILLSGDIEINPGPKSRSRECFWICHWNLNSISAQSYTKVSFLTAYNLIHNFLIICVSETFLNFETAANDPNLAIQ